MQLVVVVVNNNDKVMNDLPSDTVANRDISWWNFRFES